jgi:predicted NAD-dependent protein-ADP-ribosyltransferase YbiA (DUF1768 family)
VNEFSRKEWEATLIALESLVRNEGWRLFTDTHRQSADIALREAVAASSSTDMAKKLGANHAITTLLKWPEAQITVIRESLKQNAE